MGVENQPRVAPDLYLAAALAGGATYCLNPDSAALRAAIGRQKVPAQALFPSAALARDIEELHRMLRKQYAGYPELLQHRSFDVEAFFQRWVGELRGRAQTVPFAEGVIRYLVELKKHHADRHLQPTGWAMDLVGNPELEVAEYQGPAPKAELRSCRLPPDSGAFPGTLRTSLRAVGAGKTEPIVTVTVRGNRARTLELTCGEERAVLHRRGELPLPERKALPLYELRSHGELAVIQVRRLSGSPEELHALEQLPLEYDQHRKHGTLVFDFRGNGGGNDGYVFQWLERAKRGAFQMAPSVEIEGALYPCRDWNSLVFSQIAYGQVDAPEAIAAREELRQGWPAAPLDIHHRVSSGAVTMEADEPYPGKVYALVDRHSASSGESAPAALRAALGATLVGERTAGFLEYGNLQPFVLPETGILFWVPIVRRYYDPPAEQVGLEVDVYLDPAQLALPAEKLLPFLPR